MLAVVLNVLVPYTGIVAGGAMTIRKMILLTLAVFVPCGLLIVVLRSVLKSRFLKDPHAVVG